MNMTTNFVLIFALTVAGSAIAKDKNSDDNSRNNTSEKKYLATSAIPCTPEVGLRFSCSNKSTDETLQIVGAKCIIGAGENPEIQVLTAFDDGVAPETSEVAVVSCPDVAVPTFCTAQVSSRKNARCVVTSPAGGLNSELR